MDKFEQRLKRDADAIRAEASPEFRARIDASLQGIEPVRQARRKSSPAGLWWASSLTGLAAAAIVIALVNWNRPEQAIEPADTLATETDLPTEPELPVAPELLDFRTADFTSPLEQELINLQSDIEKARDSVQKDLDFTF